MANTQTASELVVTEYLRDFFKEYIRNNRFSRYTGTGVNNVINIKEGRKRIEIPLVTRLKGDGATGSNTLRGNGESIGNYGHLLTPSYYRHAVEFDKEEMEKPNIDLMKAARPLLMDWSMELTRDQVIKAMIAMNASGTYVDAADASEANADAYYVANSDRILFGAAISNGGGTDHSAGLGALDNTNDKLTAAVVSLAKRIAKLSDPHIRPIKTSEDEEWYVMFCGSYAFRDLKTSLSTSHQNAMPRDKAKNPIWTDGDLVYDGVIIREIPEIDAYSDTIDGSATTLDFKTGGALGIRTAPAFLCGAQALGFGLGQKPQIIVDKTYDYGFQPGVAVECKHDIDKMFFNEIQQGMVTVYTASVADS